jgi:hypothetical protein
MLGMATNFNLADVSAIVASFGRGVVFRASKWVPSSGALVMSQLGTTEGDITITPNAATAGLTIPELTGPAMHDMDYLGENPTVEIPLYLADPALIALVSPSGSAHAGRSRRGPVAEHTLAIFPEALFLVNDDQGIVHDHTVSFDGAGVWEFNGEALDAEKASLLDASFWLWRCVFNRPPRRFRGGAGDDKKNIETVSTQAMHHPDLPEGHHIYTTGDPFLAGVDLNGMS